MLAFTKEIIIQSVVDIVLVENFEILRLLFNNLFYESRRLHSYKFFSLNSFKRSLNSEFLVRYS